MSAGWGNSFSLLDEDESGEGAVRVPVKAAAPVAAKPIKEEPKAASKNAAVVDNKEANRKEVARQNPDRRPPRAREERNGDDNQQQQQQQHGASHERAFNNRGPRGVGGDREQRRERRPEHHTGADGTTRAPRQYDRKSGTGRGREEKRGGAGRGNWGSNEEEIALEQQQPPVAAADNVDVSGDAEPAASDSAPASDAAPQEPKPARELSEEEKQRIADREAEAKLMTLDEYLKQKKSLAYELPAERKAGEGEDQKQWAGFVAAKSDKSDEEAAKKAASVDERKAKEAKKVPVPADLLRFRGEQQRRDVERRESRPPRDGGDSGRRRDDGAPRAPRSSGKAAPASNKPAAEFQLATDFPALKV